MDASVLVRFLCCYGAMSLASQNPVKTSRLTGSCRLHHGGGVAKWQRRRATCRLEFLFASAADCRRDSRAPHERVQQRTAQILEETVDVVRFHRNACNGSTSKWWRRLCHILPDGIVGEFKTAPQEQILERICEQIVDVPVSQDGVLEALQLQVLAISQEIQWTRSDVESDMSWQSSGSTCSMKNDALRENKSGIKGSIRVSF